MHYIGMCRAICFSLQLVAGEVENGVGKFLDIATMERLTSQTLESQVNVAERILASAWRRLQQPVLDRTINEDITWLMYGRLSCQCLVTLTETSKRGFEEMAYGSLATAPQTTPAA